MSATAAGITVECWIIKFDLHDGHGTPVWHGDCPVGIYYSQWIATLIDEGQIGEPGVYLCSETGPQGEPRGTLVTVNETAGTLSVVTGIMVDDTPIPRLTSWPPKR